MKAVNIAAAALGCSPWQIIDAQLVAATLMVAGDTLQQEASWYPGLTMNWF